ncbi:unnamed protein product, partial [marine sediment metagenome]
IVMVLIPESETTEVNKGLRSGFLKNLLPRVSRTEGDVVPFDPLKIKQSIVKETGLNDKVAECNSKELKWIKLMLLE